MNSLIQLEKRTPVFLIIFALGCLAFSDKAQALGPAPDGCYPGYTTAEGCKALNFLTTGLGNTALGWYSLYVDSTGSFNTGVGGGALALNNADSNTAVGAGALLLNTTGRENVAVGTDALVLNDAGNHNVAIGHFALVSSNASDNAAIGAFALNEDTTGFSNTAVGADALELNTTGFGNTATGQNALSMNTTGFGNTAIGGGTLINNTVGNNNIALGIGAGMNVTNAESAICIGSPGANVGSSCFIGNIRGITTQNADAIPVLIDSNGQLGTANSSQRYKTDIKPMDKTSEAILFLNPVSFRYRAHKDTTPQFGLIAEDVAKVNPDLVIYDADGKPYTVRYDAVNAMLLNEFLKDHRKVQELEADAARQQQQIEALTAGLQKVSAQLELSKSAPHTVLNDQ